MIKHKRRRNADGKIWGFVRERDIFFWKMMTERSVSYRWEKNQVSFCEWVTINDGLTKAELRHSQTQMSKCCYDSQSRIKEYSAKIVADVSFRG